MDATDDRPLVLVVEDDPDLADLYAHWLGEEYRVRTARDADAALDALDEERASVVVLDRRLPDRSGGEALAAIRERGDDPGVALVTAVEPDLDVLSMPFDDYLVKPVAAEPLRDAVSDLLIRAERDEETRALLALASKRALLETERGRIGPDDRDEYERLRERFAERRDAVDEALAGIDGHEELRRLRREFGDGP